MISEWKIDSNVPDACIGYRAIVDSDDFIVCNPSPMGEYNAKIIAFAPNMLQLMRELLEIARKYENRDCMQDAESIIEYIES